MLTAPAAAVTIVAGQARAVASTPNIGLAGEGATSPPSGVEARGGSEKGTASGVVI